MSNSLDKSPNLDSERWQKMKALINAALELDGSSREAFLTQACGEDRELLAQIKSLLDSYSGAGNFLETPLFEGPADDEGKTLAQPADFRKPVPATLVAGTIIGSRYRIIGLLGKGGMGEVYKAEDIKLSQLVALKFLPGTLERDRPSLERFHNEVKVARQVSHPNVCRVFDIGEVDGRHFLSMEFIDGDDLSSLLRRIDRFSHERAIEISRQLCIGLAAIHNQGILHRDLKPANIIIDSLGKVRITDFGIASVADEVASESLRAGTPAYMSPEQIRGREVTVRSDIYALGLVLYEIFTGKPTFKGDSLPELLRKQELESPATPSIHVKGFDPLIEHIILQCLEKNPADRPQSALNVAMALPGGNPLQVALEAGQTPSPEMVAAAPKKGALNPGWALGGLVLGLAMLLVCLAVSMKIATNNRIPLTKSPDVLTERIQEIATRLGYRETVAEKRSGFFYDSSYLQFVGERPTAEAWSNLESGQPLAIGFRENRSTRHFQVISRGGALWEPVPSLGSDQQSISVDTRGRLIEFVAAVPQLSEVSDRRTDFAQAFQLAELDFGQFREVPSQWTPSQVFEERHAWEGVLPDHPEIKLRVEAAGYQGKVVFFKLVYPWSKPDAGSSDTYSTRAWVGLLLMVALISAVVLAACVLAWKNLKSGSGDRRGAFKVSFLVLLAACLGSFLGMNHVPSVLSEVERFGVSLKSGLFYSAVTWVVYLALEPFVRRNLPDLIISWNRLLTGDWRDPLVGRDVLIGTLWGIAHLMLPTLGMFAERAAYGHIRLFPPGQAFESLGHWPSMFLSVLGQLVAVGLLLVCGFTLICLLVRRRTYAWWVMFGLLGSVEVLFFTHSFVYLPFTLSVCALWTLVTSRSGLVASVVGYVVFVWLESTLLTLNFSVWYSSGMFMTLAVVIALLIFGYRVSSAGQVMSRGRSFNVS